MKLKKRVDSTEIFYYLFIVILLISLISSIFFAKSYVFITAIAAIGLYVVRIIRNK